jgi:hypothetical protein
MMSIKATTTENAVRTGLELCSARFKINGKAIPADMEESETMRLLNNTIKNTSKDKEEATGRMQITIPKIVATPLPPLNPAKTGKICPNKAATPRPN